MQDKKRQLGLPPVSAGPACLTPGQSETTQSPHQQPACELNCEFRLTRRGKEEEENMRGACLAQMQAPGC
jgi:hypothetical protein